MSQRRDLLVDVGYFADYLARRLDALQQIEGDGRKRSGWQQAAGLVRKIRKAARREIDDDAHARKLAKLLGEEEP